ncbi:MAG: hypothetical protein ACK50P_08405 [Planctomycetaceae bacterium]
MTRSREAALAAGLRALESLQSADGSFPFQLWWEPRDLIGRVITRARRLVGHARQTPTGPVMEQDPTFATSYLLMGAGRRLPPQSISRAGEFLLTRRDSLGMWAWGELFGKILPPDADSTACALAALALNGFPLDREAEAERLRRFWRPDLQRFRTWIAEGPYSIPERDEPVANANVLFALNALGQPPTPAEHAGVRRYLASCLAGSRYYCSPATIAHAAHRAGLDPQCLPHFARTRPGRDDLIGTIQWLCAGHRGDRAATERVLAAQQPDGSWPSMAWIKGVGVPLWGCAAVTTALAIESLEPSP